MASRRLSRNASAVAISSALWPSGAWSIGQQQPRFQIGEPSRHHQIVGRQLEPELARFLDESEILIRQRQDRDLGEVDLLLAGEREQEIERPFEAFDIDDQSRLVGRPAPPPDRPQISLELDLAGVMRSPSWRRGRERSMSAAHSARSAAISGCDLTAVRRRSAASARRGGLAGEHRHRGRHLAHFIELAVAVEDDVAAGRDRRARACLESSPSGLPWRYRRSSAIREIPASSESHHGPE